MPLTPGTHFGPYEIIAPIGRGGMGEVYRARDTRLKRDVAIKSLPEVFLRDPERLARFQREAEVLASLNHPNIAAIHGLEQSDGTMVLVLELVEGPTLADRLQHGAIPTDEALQLAKQIAEALEAAHDKGIVHRDLKPANIKTPADSRVKVDRSGKRLTTEGGAGPPSPTSLSPDESTAAVWRRRHEGCAGDLWLREFRSGKETRFTFDRAALCNGNAVWSPDGGRVVFSSGASGVEDLYAQDIRASTSEVVVASANWKVVNDWSRGGYLVYTEIDPKTGADLWYVRPDLQGGGKAKPEKFLATEFEESFGQISPDGRFIAYLSNESGGTAVYIRAFPLDAGQWKRRASVEAQVQLPRWSQDGRELYYVAGATGERMLMAAPVTERRGVSGAVELDVGPGKALFKVRVNSFHPSQGTSFYSVSKDGRFLIDYVDQASEPVLNVIVNWQQSLADRD